MLVRTLLAMLAVSFIAAIPTLARGEEKESPPLNSDLVVELQEGQSVSADGGKVPLQLRFINHTDKEQKFINTEYRITVLDKNGRQIKETLVFTTELREIVLKGRSTTDKPGMSVMKGKLKAGEDYFLVVSVRNLVGHVKFTAK